MIISDYFSITYVTNNIQIVSESSRIQHNSKIFQGMWKNWILFAQETYQIQNLRSGSSKPLLLIALITSCLASVVEKLSTMKLQMLQISCTTEWINLNVFFADVWTSAALKVSSQSRKFEFNVFSIIHLNGHNFWFTGPTSRKQWTIF